MANSNDDYEVHTLFILDTPGTTFVIAFHESVSSDSSSQSRPAPSRPLPRSVDSGPRGMPPAHAGAVGPDHSLLFGHQSMCPPGPHGPDHASLFGHQARPVIR
jgi:hypothetical protein